MTVLVDAAAQAAPTQRVQLQFPHGLPGLEEYTSFSLAGIDGLPVYWLECDDEPAIALALAEAGAVCADYAAAISEADAAELGLSCAEDALLFVVLTIPPAGGAVTANLLAPIVVSRHTGLARQIILDGSGYALRHPIAAGTGAA